MKALVALPLLLLTLANARSAAAESASVQTVLKLQQRGSLETLLAEVADPGSAHFNKPFSSREIADRLGLADRDYERLLARLKERGFQVVHEDKTRSYLIVSSSREALEKAFRVKLEYAPDGKHYAKAGPTIPSDLAAIQSLVNLDNRLVLKPHVKMAPTARLADTPTGKTPADIAAFYGFDAVHNQGFSGRGEKIATVAFNAVNPDNVRTFFTTFGITPAPQVDVVPVNGATVHLPCATQLDCDNEIEDDVDLQMAGRVAPAANLISFVGTTDDYLASWIAIFTTILDRGDIFIVNNSDDSGVDPAGSSVTGCEAMLAKAGWVTQVDPLFQRAAAQGVTIFSASGDNGSDNCGDGTQGLDWPTSPYIVSVGGTDFNDTTEVGWSGSGGGFSVLYPKPAWQTATPGSATMRGTPDIAAYAGTDPGQAVFTIPFQVGQDASWFAAGGTSLSSPTMAGFLALVNEARLAQGKPRLPYLGPVLYSMGAQEIAASFRDIVGGSNGGYTAGAGWDAVTGLGSPNAPALFKYLVNYPQQANATER